VQDDPDAVLEHNVVRLEPAKLTGIAQELHGREYPR
jgi:hypothetical protein